MTNHRQFKYNINREIGRLPKEWSLNRIEGILRNQYKISRTTFYRDRYLLQEDGRFIPSDRLEVYALLLGVSEDELKNYEISGKSLKEIDPNEDEFAIKLRQKLGLS